MGPNCGGGRQRELAPPPPRAKIVRLDVASNHPRLVETSGTVHSELLVAETSQARDTRDIVTYLYGVVQHMHHTYDSGARVSNVALDPKLMKLGKTDNSIAFLALKTPRASVTSTETCTTNWAPWTHSHRGM